MKMKRRIMAWLCAACVFLMAFPAYAAASDVISKVNVRVNVKLTSGDSTFGLSTGYYGDEDVNVSVSSGAKYDIEDAVWTKEPANGEWKLGDSPKIKVTLSALGDSYFSGTYGNSKVNVEGGTFLGASRKDRDTLVVSIGLKNVGGELEAPYDAYWSKTTRGLARWEKVNQAASYILHLYRNGALVKSISGITGNSVDCYPYMTKTGDYYFRVRAIASDKVTNIKNGAWSDDSDELEITSGKVYTGGSVPEIADSPENQVGWVASYNNWYFKYPDGTIAKNTTLQIGDGWYGFDGEGKMITGWYQMNNRNYYFHADGKMQYGGWLLLDQKWYLFETDGAMVTGWRYYNENWYCMAENGMMYEGWKQIGGNWYYFTPGEGRMVTDTYVDGLFYVDANGVWCK